MRRDTYVRLLFYPRPTQENITAPLARVAETREALGMIQGTLLNDIRINQGIRLQADYRDDTATAEKITSSPVIRIEAGYALTADSVYRILRIPPPKVAVLAAKREPQPSHTIIPRSAYDRLADKLYSQMQDLEAPIIHLQVIFKIHEAHFVRVRGDVLDPFTDKAISGEDLLSDFPLVLEGLRYYYATDDKERNQRTTELWLAGHRLLAAISSALTLEQDFLLEKGYLPLFAETCAMLGRLFRAINHIGTFRAEADDATSY